MNRREMLGRSVAAMLGGAVALRASEVLDADSILKRIYAPVFPTRTFEIT